MEDMCMQISDNKQKESRKRFLSPQLLRGLFFMFTLILILTACEMYDANGFNDAGIHQDTGTRYNPDGYDANGFDAGGYNADGYDARGYDAGGYDADGYDARGYDPGGYDADGYDKRGYDAGGYDKDGYDTRGYDASGFNAEGKHRDTGTEYDQYGYDKDGYNAAGFNLAGIHRNGTQYDGPNGYDEDGYNAAGFNAEGIHRVTGTFYNPYGYTAAGVYRDDFTTLTAAGNADPSSIWSDGTTMWVGDTTGLAQKIYAYKISDKSPDTDKEFNTLITAGNYKPIGLYSDGTTMWVSDFVVNIYAYNMETKARDGSSGSRPKEFTSSVLSTAGNDAPRGIWSNGTTMWVLDNADKKIYAYNMETKARDESKEFAASTFTGNTDPAGIWSDGTTMWVGNYDDQKILAYDLAAGARPPTE